MSKVGKIVLIIVLVLVVIMVGLFVWIGKPIKGESFSFSGLTQNVKEFFVKTELKALQTATQKVDNYEVKITTSQMGGEITYLKAKDRVKMTNDDISGTENYYYLDDNKLYIYNISSKIAMEMTFMDEDEGVDPEEYWDKVDLEVRNLGFEVIDGEKCYVFKTEDDEGSEMTLYLRTRSPVLLIRIKTDGTTFDYEYSRIGNVTLEEVTLPDEAKIQKFPTMPGIGDMPIDIGQEIGNLPEVEEGEIPQ